MEEINKLSNVNFYTDLFNSKNNNLIDDWATVILIIFSIYAVYYIIMAIIEMFQTKYKINFRSPSETRSPSGSRSRSPSQPLSLSQKRKRKN